METTRWRADTHNAVPAHTHNDVPAHTHNDVPAHTHNDVITWVYILVYVSLFFYHGHVDLPMTGLYRMLS